MGELNQDGLAPGQPVTAEQIREAERKRSLATTDTLAFKVHTQQQQHRQRKRRAEEEQQP